MSEHGAFDNGVPVHVGKLGDPTTTAEGARAARDVMLHGVAALPLGFAVEIEATFELRER